MGPQHQPLSPTIEGLLYKHIRTDETQNFPIKHSSQLRNILQQTDRQARRNMHHIVFLQCLLIFHCSMQCSMCSFGMRCQDTNEVAWIRKLLVIPLFKYYFLLQNLAAPKLQQVRSFHRSQRMKPSTKDNLMLCRE